MSALAYHCPGCGETHDLPLAFHADLPAAVDTIPAAEQGARVDCDGELCVIDETFFFVHGVLQLPIVDLPPGAPVAAGTPFEWGVWCSLSRAAFDRTVARWEDPARADEPPHFAWLATELPYPTSTVNLRTRVRTRAVGLRPTVHLEPADPHPLAVEQRTGITLAEVEARAMRLLHPPG